MTESRVTDEAMDEKFLVDATNGRLMEATEWEPTELAKQLDRTPLSDNLIVRRRLYNTETESGIIRSVSDEHKELSATQGVVVTTGPDVVNLKSGDEVVFVDHHGRSILGQDGKPYYLISEEHIQAIVGQLERKLISKSEMRIKESRACR